MSTSHHVVATCQYVFQLYPSCTADDERTDKNVKFKPTRKGPQAPSGATAPSLPATPVQPAPAALPEVPTITEAQTGQQKRKEERLPVPSQDVPESAPQPESITPAVRETTPPSESARDSSLGISIAGRDAAPTGLSHATARRSATQTIDIPGSSDEDEGEDASNDQETRRQRDVSPAARAAPASVNNADPAALQLAAAEPPRAIASKGLPHLTTASQSGNAAAPNVPAELQAATRPKSTEPAQILEKIRESMPADLQQLGQASSSVQAAPQSQAQSQSQSQIQSQSQSQPRSHSHFQSQSQSQSQKPQSQSQKAKTLKFVPSRKLGSQRTAAERRQLEVCHTLFTSDLFCYLLSLILCQIASDDSGFEEETSSQTKKNKKMPKATQKRRAQPLSSQSTKRRRIAADAEEDQATEGIAERREPGRSTEAADILVVRNPPSSVPGSLEDATNQQRRSKAVDRSGQKALPPKADRPKKRKKKADQDEDHDATIIIDEETGLARPAKEKIVRKRSKKALNSAAPEAEVDGNAMALVLLPTSEADDRPIDPTQTTMAQICKDPGKGRMSSRFEAMMEAKAAEKQRRKEARERMKRLAKGGHASEGSGDEQTEQMAIGDNVTDQIQDEAVNRETATNEDDNSATQHLAGRKSRSQSQHAIEQLDASGNAAGEGAAQPAEEEHTFTESHLVGRGRLVNGRIVLDEDAMIIDRPIDVSAVTFDMVLSTRSFRI